MHPLTPGGSDAAAAAGGGDSGVRAQWRRVSAKLPQSLECKVDLDFWRERLLTHKHS